MMETRKPKPLEKKKYLNTVTFNYTRYLTEDSKENTQIKK